MDVIQSDSDNFTGSSRSEDLHTALCIPELVQKILQYVINDPDEYRNERDVERYKICPMWEGICLEIINSKNWFFIDPNHDNESKLMDYLDQIHWKYHSFICWLMPPQISRIVIDKIGFQLQEFQLRVGKYGTVSDFEALLEFLGRNCRKLRTFHILFPHKEVISQGVFSSSRSYSLPIQTLIADGINNAKQLRFAQKIIENSPRISKINLETDEIRVVTGVLRTIINSPRVMRTLKELNLPRPFLHSRSPPLLNYFVYNPWRISSFQTSFGESVLLEHVHLLLNSFRETLQHLDINFENCLLESYGQEMEEAKFQDYVIVPLSLTKLKKLVISHVPSKSLALVNALLLPNLQHFAFLDWECDCYESQIFEEVVDWAEMDIVNQGLRELSLKYVNDVTIFNFSPNPWKNLLSLQLSTESAEVVRAIFQNVVNLERFELFIAEGEQKSWMDIFTGKRKAPVGLGVRFDNNRSIRNLKRLKFLKIGGSQFSNLVFMDIFIFHGLLQLKELQCVQLHHTKFTYIAVDILKSSMLPFCRLEFQEQKSFNNV